MSADCSKMPDSLCSFSVYKPQALDEKKPHRQNHKARDFPVEYNLTVETGIDKISSSWSGWNSVGHKQKDWQGKGLLPIEVPYRDDVDFRAGRTEMIGSHSFITSEHGWSTSEFASVELQNQPENTDTLCMSAGVFPMTVDVLEHEAAASQCIGSVIGEGNGFKSSHASPLTVLTSLYDDTSEMWDSMEFDTTSSNSKMCHGEWEAYWYRQSPLASTPPPAACGYCLSPLICETKTLTSLGYRNEQENFLNATTPTRMDCDQQIAFLLEETRRLEDEAEKLQLELKSAKDKMKECVWVSHKKEHRACKNGSSCSFFHGSAELVLSRGRSIASKLRPGECCPFCDGYPSKYGKSEAKNVSLAAESAKLG